jgi:hypothetical protein
MKREMLGRRAARRRKDWGFAMKMLRVAAVGLLFFIGGMEASSAGQMPQGPATPQTPSGASKSGSLGMPMGRGVNEPEPSSPVRMEQQQARARNNDRQKKLVADTDKLLSLATELKSQVDKTNKDVLSVEVIKKAEEIEKLAHSVKERMKG